MSVELHIEDGAAGPSDRRCTNIAGDLPTVLQAGPMFRRSVAGYDRFQVDTYVRWAEDELATADREREHLVTRHLRTRAALNEARELLSHSSGGRELHGLSRRIGTMLTAAADEAEAIRAEADADRAAASAEAQGLVAHAERALADARAEAELMVAEASAEAGELIAEAGRIVAAAEQTGREARIEAEARLEKVRAIEQRAVEHAERLHQQAVEEAAVARLQARDEVVRMLSTGREERRRADAAAASTRRRLDRDAVSRRAFLLAEIEVLEHRRSALRAEVDLLVGPVADTDEERLSVHLRRFAERLRWWPRSLRTP